MKFAEEFKKWTDNAGVTDKSKIYTPFTMLCIVFTVYFSFYEISEIWLETDKVKKLEAIKNITDTKFGEWWQRISYVIGSALGMTLIYAFGQAASAGLWSIGNKLNAELAYWANRPKYKLIEDYEVIKAQSDERASKIESLEREILRIKSEIKKLKNSAMEAEDALAKQTDTYKNSLSLKAEENRKQSIRMEFIRGHRATICSLQGRKEGDLISYIKQHKILEDIIDVAKIFQEQTRDGKIKKYSIPNEKYSVKLGNVLGCLEVANKGIVNTIPADAENNFVYDFNGVDFEKVVSDFELYRSSSLLTA